MEIDSVQQSDVTILTLDGRLDSESSPSLEKIINDFISDGRKQFLFDCTKLNYISSAGLRVFLLCSKQVNAADGRIAFSSLQDGIVEIFELSGFDSLFTSYPDLDAALDDFA